MAGTGKRGILRGILASFICILMVTAQGPLYSHAAKAVPEGLPIEANEIDSAQIWRFGNIVRTEDEEALSKMVELINAATWKTYTPGGRSSSGSCGCSYMILKLYSGNRPVYYCTVDNTDIRLNQAPHYYVSNREPADELYKLLQKLYRERENRFRDVEKSGAAEEIDWMLGRGFMNGVDERYFRPREPLTRAMLAAIIYRMETAASAEVASGGSAFPISNPYNDLYQAKNKGAVIMPPEEDLDAERSRFGDVDEGAWYADAIYFASASGLIFGYPDGSFRPEKEVTREELATIIRRYAEGIGCNMNVMSERARWDGYSLKEPLERFDDKDELSSYAEEGMIWCLLSYIMEQGEGGALAPKALATRKEAAKALYTVYQRSGRAYF